MDLHSTCVNCEVTDFFLLCLPIVSPVVRYHVDVYTGQLKQAETEAAVSLCLFGERGDSGLRLLHKSNMPVRFRRGQVSLGKGLFKALANLFDHGHM